MFNRKVVQEALNQSWVPENNQELAAIISPDHKSSVTSLLIHDVFGGDILKTHKKKGWHFYNLIDGERVDFTRSEKGRSIKHNRFEDIPSSREEVDAFFEQEEYSTFMMRFIWAFEEAIGLEKHRSCISF
jgi:hypothetical protein